MEIELREVARLLGRSIEADGIGHRMEHRLADDRARRPVFCAARAES